MNYPPQGPPPQGPPPGNFGAPQGHPGQWGPPPQQPPWPQQQWPPSPPPKKHNGWKWALGAVALLAVIGVTAAVTISATSDGEADKDSLPPQDTYGLASADDKGPVNVITEEPTCAAWAPIQTTLANTLTEEWGKRDPSIPASSWTPQQQAQYEAAADAFLDAAKQTEPLVKLTPHRVVRELYEQFISYSRAFAQAVPAYEPVDDHLVGVANVASSSMGFICGAIKYGSAEARAPFLPIPPAPEQVAELSDPSDPERLLTNPNSTCPEWDRLLHDFVNDTEDWQSIDVNTPASSWTPQQRQIMESVTPVLRDYADKIQALVVRSNSPVIEDLATLSAQYRRAYADSLPTYTSADAYLSRAANRLTSVIYEACKAVGS